MYGDEIESSFEAFAESLLSEDTDVRSLFIRKPGASLWFFDSEKGEGSISTDEGLGLIDRILDEGQLRVLTVNLRV